MFSVEENLPCGRLAEVQEDERSFCPVHIFNFILISLLWVLLVHVEHKEIYFSAQKIFSPFQRCSSSPSPCRTEWETQGGEWRPQDKQGPQPPGRGVCALDSQKTDIDARENVQVAKSHLKQGKLNQLRAILFFYHRNLLPSWNFRIIQVALQEKKSPCFQIFVGQRLAWMCEDWRRHWEDGRCHWAPPPTLSLFFQPGKLFHGEPLPSSSYNFDKSEFIACHLWLSSALLLYRVVSE